MAKFGYFLICALLIHTGYALQCYNCVSTSANKNCDDLAEKDKIAVATCGKAISQDFIPACIKKVIEDKSTKMQNTTRACILKKAEKTDTPTRECDAASDRINVIACEICTDELCNAVDHLHVSVFAIVASILTFVLAKYAN